MFGFLLEQYVGRWRYGALLASSAFFSNLMSGIAYPYYVSVGSAGFVFGVIALYISFIVNKSEQLGQQRYPPNSIPRNLVISLFVLLVAANFLSMIDTKAIDIAGIIGGFFTGSVLSFAYY
jgi:membrane associated rhomboid family serine protease